MNDSAIKYCAQEFALKENVKFYLSTQFLTKELVWFFG